MNGQTDHAGRVYFQKWQVIVAIVVGVPAMFLAILHIWDWFNESSGPDLIISSDFGPYSLPPQLLSKMDEQKEELQETKRELNDASDEKSLLIPDAVHVPKSSPDFADIESFLRFTITNRGDAPAKEVFVKWTPKAYVEVKWDGGKKELLEFATKVDLNSLRGGGESATLSVWPVAPMAESPIVSYVGNSVQVPLADRQKQTIGHSPFGQAMFHLLLFLMGFYLLTYYVVVAIKKIIRDANDSIKSMLTPKTNHNDSDTSEGPCRTIPSKQA
jgi:hypothetical protein